MAGKSVVSDHEWVDVDAVVLGTTTAQAVRVKIGDHIEWVPRQCLEDEGEVVDVAIRDRKFMPAVVLRVAVWKATQEGWI